MKMTEKMKQELEEYMKKEGVELSDEELDRIAGGEDMDEALRRLLWKFGAAFGEPKFEWGIDYHFPWVKNHEG